MNLFDSTFTLLLVDDKAAAPPGARAAFDHLLGRLDKTTVSIIIPTPVLSEMMYNAGVAAVQAYISQLRRQRRILIAPFDERAAVELGVINATIKARTGPKRGGQSGDWAKVKFDRQILAIAIANGASTIYTDDDDLQKLAHRNGLQATRISELPPPPAKPEDAQLGLFDRDGNPINASEPTDEER